MTAQLVDTSSVPTFSVRPVTVEVPDRLRPLQVKVTAPTVGDSLPVIVFSHGYEWSMDAYEPLAHRWAQSGFVVIQPTHLDSRRYGIGLDNPAFSDLWRVRIADLHAIINRREEVLSRIPTLDGRVRSDLLAAVGHSWGGQTAGAILGARVQDVYGVTGEDFSHPDVIAGALLAATGVGDALTPFAERYLPFARPDFGSLQRPTLVVAGGQDQSAMSTRGPEWFEDAYWHGPTSNRLLVLNAAEHLLGGIAGEDVKETTDENPTRVLFVADAVQAHLATELGLQRAGWAAFEDLASSYEDSYRIRTKIG